MKYDGTKIGKTGVREVGEDCLDLKTHFSDRFRVVDEAYLWTRKMRPPGKDPWYHVLLCQNGHICPWGGDALAACTKTTGPIATRLKRLSFTQVAHDGDDGTDVLFGMSDFDEIAEIMKPRRCRRLSEAQKQAASERLRPYQPAKGQSVKDVVHQRSGIDRESPQITIAMSEAFPSASGPNLTFSES